MCMADKVSIACGIILQEAPFVTILLPAPNRNASMETPIPSRIPLDAESPGLLRSQNVRRRRLQRVFPYHIALQLTAEAGHQIEEASQLLDLARGVVGHGAVRRGLTVEISNTCKDSRLKSRRKTHDHAQH